MLLLRLTIFRIYTLEKKQHGALNQPQDEEQTALIGDSTDPDAIFSRALDSELHKISEFYQLKELELFGEVDELKKDQGDYDEARENELGASTDFDFGGPSRRKSIFASASSNTSKSIPPSKRRPSQLVPVDNNASDSDNSDDEPISPDSIKKRPRRKSRADSEADTGKARRSSIAYAEFNEGDLTQLFDQRITLKRRTISLYVSLVELKSFIQLNKTGFTKALKKYDKIMNRSLRNQYIEKFVNPAHVFQKTTIGEVSEHIASIEEIYADLVVNGDVEAAKRELRLHLREHVVWERNTVWREMIGIERKAQAANMGIKRTLLGPDGGARNVRLQGDEVDVMDTKEYSTPVGKLRIPHWLLSSHLLLLLISIAIFIVLLIVPIFDTPEQQNCFAILVFASMMWATEVSLSYLSH